MKTFIPLIYLVVTIAVAEPPVGDGYPSSRGQSDHQHDHHGSGHQRSLSQEYGPPSYTAASSRNAPLDGNEYNAPNARTSSNSQRQSQHRPATVRVSFNQRFGTSARSSATARNSGQDHKAPGANSLSQGYAAPNVRSSVSQEYGPPTAKSVSQEYGVPSAVAGRTVSTEYGLPNARSDPSEEYGVPAIAARNNQKSHSFASNFRSAQSKNDFSAPATRSQFQSNSRSEGYTSALERSNNAAQDYDAFKPFGKTSLDSQNALSSTYGAPASRSLSTSYGAPSARNSNTYSEDEKEVNDMYPAPSARGVPQEYGVPSANTNLNTETSSYTDANSRSSPSSSYLPASRGAAPSEQYGAPDQRDGASQGYDHAAQARSSDEILNQEPANYDFAYQIEDQESGSDFGHTETREENRAEGSYFVVLPDGSKQTVDYEADERGYKPRISVEPVDVSARSGSGYDDNAAEIVEARAAQGPY